jgi:hypothetical protein
MKKLRGVTDEGRDALLRDLRAVNLSKYVTEAAAALAEGRHKAGDVWAAVEVASELHRTYAEFGGLLGPALAKLVPAAGAATGGEGGEPLPPLQRRLKLRLLTELVLVVRAPSRCLCACYCHDMIKPQQSAQHGMCSRAGGAQGVVSDTAPLLGMLKELSADRRAPATKHTHMHTCHTASGGLRADFCVGLLACAAT